MYCITPCFAFSSRATILWDLVCHQQRIYSKGLSGEPAILEEIPLLGNGISIKIRSFLIRLEATEAVISIR
jgi:hypothetical protein